MRKKRDSEFDLHVWAKPENETMVALYTVSIGQRTVCVDMPLDEALDHIRDILADAG